ncbi:MAG: hypothetical protein HYR55_03290 [Acidobacteria bacterium]|nr:hypothetical protein [Acidobacteriota bacterium]
MVRSTGENADDDAAPVTEISDDAGSRTPRSVQRWIVELIRRMAHLKVEVSAVQEQ